MQSLDSQQGSEHHLGMAALTGAAGEMLPTPSQDSIFPWLSTIPSSLAPGAGRLGLAEVRGSGRPDLPWDFGQAPRQDVCLEPQL